MTMSRLDPARPKPPSYDALLAAIAAAASSADLVHMRATAQQYFMGTQRDELVAAVEQRQAELADGETLGA